VNQLQNTSCWAAIIDLDELFVRAETHSVPSALLEPMTPANDTSEWIWSKNSCAIVLILIRDEKEFF
jgi:hypothetical protein